METVRYGHYTSSAGLLGIIQTQLLWATNIKFLNDEHEFQHALNFLKELTSKTKISTNDPLRPAVDEFLNRLLKKLEMLDSYHSETVFTFSFSEQTDLLSQWRGYCSSNNGYCIVFDAQALFDAVKEKFENCYLVKCVYDDAQKEDELRKSLNTWWHKYRAVTGEQAQARLIDEFSEQIVLFASYFKHFSFKEEQEHRIVVLTEYASSKPFKFRTGRSSLIPYLELPAPRNLIKEICIGPNSNKLLAQRALESFLESSYAVPFFVSDIEVTFSKTPYRPW